MDRALAVAPNDSMYSNRGIVLQAMGRYPEAVQSYKLALSLRPRAAEVLCNLGTVYQSMGDTASASKAFEECLTVVPDYALALEGLGTCKLRAQDLVAAEALTRRALALNPELPTALTNLGIAHWSAGRFEEARLALLEAIACAPGLPDAWDRLGVVYTEMNQIQEARQAFEKAAELGPNSLRQMRKRLLLSHVQRSREELERELREFSSGIEAMMGEPSMQGLPSAHSFLPAIFASAYLAVNTRPLLERLAQMFLHLYPELQYKASHLDRPRLKNERVRIGFFSVHVRDHSVSRCFAGLIKDLAQRPDLEIVLISNNPLPKAPAVNPYAGFPGRFVRISSQTAEAREAIAGLELDILLYQDIGMDEVSYFLGYARLAKVQGVLGGHPVTTGLPCMDLYVSSALGEYEGSEKHYSEQLVTLDPGTAYFERPKLPDTFKERVELGLPAQGNLYVCPMMLQKIHTDFDEAVAEILSLDKEGHVVFFAHSHAGWERDLKARLLRRLGKELGQRLIFLPWISNRDDFASINHHAAVVLDPFHFGIGSTAITTVAVGAPFVTWPAPFLRGRVGLVYARLLELPECVAESQQAYPALAVRIATDAELRASLRQRILAHSDRFYNSNQYLDTTRAFLTSLAASLTAPGAASLQETA